MLDCRFLLKYARPRISGTQTTDKSKLSSWTRIYGCMGADFNCQEGLGRGPRLARMSHSSRVTGIEKLGPGERDAGTMGA